MFSTNVDLLSSKVRSQAEEAEQLLGALPGEPRFLPEAFAANGNVSAVTSEIRVIVE